MPPMLTSSAVPNTVNGKTRGVLLSRIGIPPLLNQTARDSYTTVTPCAAPARRSSVGLTVLSPVNRASRGRQPSL